MLHMSDIGFSLAEVSLMGAHRMSESCIYLLRAIPVGEEYEIDDRFLVRPKDVGVHPATLRKAWGKLHRLGFFTEGVEPPADGSVTIQLSPKGIAARLEVAAGHDYIYLSIAALNELLGVRPGVLRSARFRDKAAQARTHCSTYFNIIHVGALLNMSAEVSRIVDDYGMVAGTIVEEEPIRPPKNFAKLSFRQALTEGRWDAIEPHLKKPLSTRLQMQVDYAKTTHPDRLPQYILFDIAREVDSH